MFAARYLEAKRICPNCQHKWCVDLGKSMHNLRKVTKNNAMTGRVVSKFKKSLQG